MIRISDAELEVMNIIWERKETTSLEIIDDLKSTKWNFNTIRTLIKRLQNKGAIEVSGRKGKTYTYRAIIDEKEYKKEMAKELIRKLYHNSIREFMLEYCGANNITVEEVKKLMDYIKEKNAREEAEKEKNAKSKKDTEDKNKSAES